VLTRLARSPGPVALVLLLLCLALGAIGTHAIGVHAAFGAFLVGCLVPHDSPLAARVGALPTFVVQGLMPAFFAWTGMRTQLGLIDGWQGWLTCLGLVALASAGKVGGAGLAAGRAGLSRSEGLALGLLMNTRGLVELIVLGIGLDLGLLSPALFAMLFVMALATTLATVPLLRWLTPEVLDLKGSRSTQSAPRGA